MDRCNPTEPLFHVATRVLPTGQLLRPNAVAQEYLSLIRLANQAASIGPESVRRLVADAEWGLLRQLGGHQAEMVLLEALFERARIRTTPRLPSRLDAIFAWGSLALASRFRTEYHPSGVIHRCALVQGTAIERDGALIVEAFETADLASPKAADLQLVEERAVRYWRARAPMALPEVLVRGRVMVETVVESNYDARAK